MGHRWFSSVGIGGLVAVAAAGLIVPGRASAADPSSAERDGLTGAEAVRALGGRLASVARDAGWSEGRLRRELARDGSLHVDAAGGSVFYVDTAHVELAPTVAAANVPPGAVVPLTDTFTLHSKPGALRTLYIDVNGHTTRSTRWNRIFDSTIVSQPFDVDGKTSSFNETELQIIQGIWSRVADDYDMFSIDVTTQEPRLSDLVRTSSSDQRFGQRAVVTRSNIVNPALGVALIGSFGNNVDTPVFVFSRIDSKPYSVVHGLAHGVSHEVGHALGLSHDGDASQSYYYGTLGGWGPIMGGAGRANYVTWGAGEYASASNIEDDLAVMASFGVDREGDAVGDSTASATPVAVEFGRFAASGRIETREDVDMFSIAGGSLLDITVTPSAPFEPNLDLQLQVLDESGQVLATSDPPDRGAPSIRLAAGPGQYFLRVDGVGRGNPATANNYSDYASLGRYDVTGVVCSLDAAVGCAPTAQAFAAASGAPLGMAFSSSGSSDPEGGALGYMWSFGDGAGSTEANPMHAYPGPGSYTAILTVTDVGLQPSFASVNVVVADPAKQLRIKSMTGVRVRKGLAKVSITVVDGYGKPVKSALVKGRWQGSKVTKSGYTNSKGVVTFSRATSTATGFDTTKVSRSKRTWDGVNFGAAVPVR